MEDSIISSKTGIKLQEIQYKKKLLYVTFSYIVLIPNWTKMGIHKKFKPLKLFETQIQQNSHNTSHIEQKNSIFLCWHLPEHINEISISLGWQLLSFPQSKIGEKNTSYYYNF